MITLTFSADEIAALQEIRRAGAYQTEADAIRGALFWFGRYLNLDLPADHFALAPVPIAATDDQPDLFADPIARCPACDGDGVVELAVDTRQPWGEVVGGTIERRCEACGGSGEMNGPDPEAAT